MTILLRNLQIAADPSGAPITQLTHTAHNVVSGSGAGLIAMRDPRTLETTQTMSAHPGGVQGLHGSGHQLYSYGYTMVCVPLLQATICTDTRD